MAAGPPADGCRISYGTEASRCWSSGCRQLAKASVRAAGWGPPDCGPRLLFVFTSTHRM